MHVLVTHASRSGATDAIARRVADRLRARSLTVQLVAVDEVEDVEAYDAVVIGGGTAGTHWLRPARHFVQRHEEELARRPVWLFGSATATTDTTDTTDTQDGATEPGAAAARPQEFDEFHELVEAEDEAVFVRPRTAGEQPPGPLTRLWQRLSGGPDPQRVDEVHDQARVDAWADGIADRLERLRRDRAIDDAHRVHESDERSGGESDRA